MTRTFAIVVALAAVLGVSAVVAAQVERVVICHVPPGHPEAAQTITVGQPAVEEHMNEHEDALGACPGDAARSPGDQGNPGSNPGTNPDQPTGPTPSAVAAFPTYWLGLLLVVLAGIAIGTVAALRRRQTRNR
jgi:hypothetical protein